MDAATLSILLKLGVVLILILINGFFVAAEFALVSVRPTRIDQLVARGNPLARTVRRAMNDPNRFISAAQMGITMASLALGWIGEPAVAQVVEPVLAGLPNPWSWLSAHAVAIVISYALITLLHIVLGEQVPKMIALQRAEATILLSAQPTQLISVLFRPAIALVYWSTELVLRPLGITNRNEHTNSFSVDELRMLIASSRQRGDLDAGEEAIMQRVFGFADLTADQVMVPRTEMVALPVSASLRDALEVAARSRHARLPVYRDTLDDIVGIFHTKDLFQWLSHGEGPEKSRQFSLPRLMRPALTVPESITADALLAELRRRKTHLAIVIDEYGGTAGLVALEDLAERLVGDVGDEFALAVSPIEELPDGSALIDGLLSIDEINQRFGLRIEDEFNNTIAGHVFSLLGRKPEVDDRVAVADRVFVVEALDGLRIAKLRLLPPQEVGAEREKTVPDLTF